MARFLKENTATRITVGPFLDVGDGFTPELALTVTGIHLTLVVDDAGVPTLALDADATVSGGDNDMAHITNDNAGFYDLELTAAQVNFTGRAMFAAIDDSEHLPVFHEFQIVRANVYDSLFIDSDTLDVQVTGMGANVLTATAIAGDAITEAKIADNAIASEHIAANAIGASELATDAIGSDQIAATAAVEIGNAVWDTDATARQGAGSFGQAIGDPGANAETIYEAVVEDAAGANIAADIIVIESQTDDIGIAGAGLTDLGGMSDGMKAEVESEANDALVALDLDHLINVSVADEVANNSIIAHMVSATEDWSTFDPSAESLEALRARGDAAWTTGAGGSPFTVAAGTIGATGNDATHLHLDGLTQGDDELNELLIVITDVSTGELHSRWIDDWAIGTELATVVTLPFTPEASTDTYTVLGIRKDVNADEIEGADPSDTIRDAVVDDATRIDASALNTASGAVGSDGTGLTEAGGDGDHLTAINLPDQTMDITGSLSGAVGSVTGAVGSVAGNVDGSVASNVELGPAEVNSEMVDVMKTDTLTATPQGAPPTTPTFEEAVMVLYDAIVHGVDVTATLKTFKNNAGVVIWKKALSDDATTYAEAESASGPA